MAAVRIANALRAVLTKYKPKLPAGFERYKPRWPKSWGRKSGGGEGDGAEGCLTAFDAGTNVGQNLAESLDKNPITLPEPELPPPPSHSLLEKVPTAVLIGVPVAAAVGLAAYLYYRSQRLAKEPAVVIQAQPDDTREAQNVENEDAAPEMQNVQNEHAAPEVVLNVAADAPVVQNEAAAAPEMQNVQNEHAAPEVVLNLAADAPVVQNEAAAAPDAPQGQAQNDDLQAPALTGEDKIKHYLATRNVKKVNLTVFFEALGLPSFARDVRPLAPTVVALGGLSESALEGLGWTEIQISEVESALNYVDRLSGDYVLV